MLSDPTSSAPVFAVIRRDVVRVEGPDAIGFLQGQLSQDIAGLAVGGSAWSFLLQPQGKVDAWVRVHRTADDAVAIDVDPGWGAATRARIERFKLRTKAEVSVDEGVPTVAVRGLELAGGRPAGWPGLEGSDHLGSAEAPEGLPAAARLIDADEYEALRITHGVPAMGSELTDATIPAEAGQWVVDASVSFTKGCYTGQELVARVDSRGGNVPRRLRAFVTTWGGHDIAAGDVVNANGEEVGVVTSVARKANQQVGLAYVKRSAVESATATVHDASVSFL